MGTVMNKVLPKHFLDFLKEQDVYDRYSELFQPDGVLWANDKDTHEWTERDYVIRAFMWCDTHEGEKFWVDVHEAWMKCVEMKKMLLGVNND